jgi:hypothetical protein
MGGLLLKLSQCARLAAQGKELIDTSPMVEPKSFAPSEAHDPAPLGQTFD